MSNRRLPEEQAHKEKLLAMDIAEKADAIIKSDKTKIGILLCEGLENSIDKALYTVAYPEFVIVPSNGCSDIKKMQPRVCKFSEYPVFAIIDRDSMSKKKVKQLSVRGIFATNLPFIENIICCPEVLKIISRRHNLNYQEIIRNVRTTLTAILVEKLMNLNPFDFDMPQDCEILRVNIDIVTKNGTVSNLIDVNNVMYTFRNKMIVSEVANALGHQGKEWYYKFIMDELANDLDDELVSAMRKYLPEIIVKEIDDY